MMLTSLSPSVLDKYPSYKKEMKCVHDAVMHFVCSSKKVVDSPHQESSLTRGKAFVF